MDGRDWKCIYHIGIPMAIYGPGTHSLPLAIDSRAVIARTLNGFGPSSIASRQSALQTACTKNFRYHCSLSLKKGQCSVEKIIPADI